VNPETSIDKTLHDELPGILAELIALCPSVIRDGLMQPSSVKDATAELFAELDVAARFSADCLVDAPDEVAVAADVSTAARQWLHREGLDVHTTEQSLMGELRKRFGKRYGVRKVSGRSTRVFLGVRLLDDEPKAILGGAKEAA
jgi:phage/plasmid-associated DNA primase